MPLPSMLQSNSFKRLAQGAAVGAVATMIIGFSWGGWLVESTAAKRADEASRTAVVAVLAPICVDRFQRSADATNNFIELKKVSTYMQGSFVEKGGWATSPGRHQPDRLGPRQAAGSQLRAGAKPGEGRLQPLFGRRRHCGAARHHLETAPGLCREI